MNKTNLYQEMTDVRKIMEELQKPFQENEIEWRVGSTNGDKTKGLALAYVTNRAIQNRLDKVFGCMGWKNEFKEWKGNSQLCGISVFYNGEWITKWDGSDNSEVEQIKGGLSDSMKRSAYQWGIGRYLYDLESTWVKIKAVGKSYYLAETPKLPDWALPSNNKESSNDSKENKQSIQKQSTKEDKPKQEDRLTDTQKNSMKSIIRQYLNDKDLEKITSNGGKMKANIDIDSYTDKQLCYVYAKAKEIKAKNEMGGLPV